MSVEERDQRRQAEADTLRRIRASVAALDGFEWHIQLGGGGDLGSIDARSSDGSIVKIADLDPKATADEIAMLAGGLSNCRFLLRLVDRCSEARRADRLRALPDGHERNEPARPVSKDYAAECAMKCAEPAFKKYLEETHGLERPLTDERSATKVRSILGVRSRSELNSNDIKAVAWRQVVKDFERWKRQ